MVSKLEVIEYFPSDQGQVRRGLKMAHGRIPFKRFEITLLVNINQQTDYLSTKVCGVFEKLAVDLPRTVHVVCHTLDDGSLTHNT
jgi:hypothetical protein